MHQWLCGTCEILWQNGRPLHTIITHYTIVFLRGVQHEKCCAHDPLCWARRSRAQHSRSWAQHFSCWTTRRMTIVLLSPTKNGIHQQSLRKERDPFKLRRRQSKTLRQRSRTCTRVTRTTANADLSYQRTRTFHISERGPFILADADLYYQCQTYISGSPRPLSFLKVS